MSKLTIQSGSRNHFESAGTVLVIISEQQLPTAQVRRDGSRDYF